MKFVTAIDEAYFPGLVALNNSFKANAGDATLACMVYGSDELVQRVEGLGIEVISNPYIPAYLPTSEFWPEASPAMYARLLVPLLFDSPCAWIDADCIVLGDLGELATMRFDEPVAAVMTSTKSLVQQVGNLKGANGVMALFSGLLVFNAQKWRELDITPKCFEVMNTRHDLVFHYAVQSVLNLVLMGRFKEIGYKWQEFANRGPISEDCKIVHYVGGLPWKDHMKNLDIWNRYA